MADPLPKPSAAKKRWRFGWFAACAIVLCVVAAAVPVYNHYTAPERIRLIAEEYLQQYARGRVNVGSAEFSWRGGIHLSDVSVAERPREAPRGAAEPRRNRTPIFYCRKIELAHDPWAVCLGRLKIESVLASEPTCRIVRNADGTTNLAGLLPTGVMAKSEAAPNEPLALPTVELRDARVEVVHRRGRIDRTIEDIRLTVRGLPAGKNSKFYDIVWQGGGRHVATGRSRVDLMTGGVRNLSGGLPWLSVEAVMIAVNAEYQEAGNWCDLLGLDGSVRASDYQLALGNAADDSLSATIELQDASLSIPVKDDEYPLAPEKRYLRFEKVFGTIRVTPSDLHAEFDALFHGSECSVSADLRGGMETIQSLDDIAFDVHATVRQLLLPRIGPDAPPEEGRFVQYVRPIAKFYRDYDPHGRVDVDVYARKDVGADQPIVLRRMALTARGCDASCRWFPCRVEGVTGVVEFLPEGVFIRDVGGTRDDGSVVVNGWLEKPKRWSAARVNVSAANIRIDDELFAAAPDTYRRVGRHFNPEGMLDVELALTRPAGENQQPAKWDSHCLIGFHDISACYVHVPYPLEHVSGSLVVDGDQAQVADVRVRSNDTEIDIDGVITFDSAGTNQLDLRIDGRDIPFSDELLTAVPNEIERAVRPFHPTGAFNLRTEVTRDMGMRSAEQRSSVELQDVTLKHDAFPISIENVTGTVRVTPERTTFENLAGRYGDGTVTATGGIERTADGSYLDVTIDSEGVQIDEAARSAAPPALQAALSDWRINGPISTSTRLATEATVPPGPTKADTTIELDGVSVRHARFPKPFDDVHAVLTLDDSGLHTTGAAATYGPATLTVDLDSVQGEEGTEADMRLNVHGLPLDESVRGILPERHQAAWDRRELSGTVDLHLDRLAYHRPSGRPGVWQVDGRATMTDVALHAGGDIENVSGTLTMAGVLVDRLGGTALDGELALDTIRVGGHDLSEVATPWSFAQLAEGGGRLSFDAVTGAAYDGVLSSRYELLFSETSSHYNLSATAHNLDLAMLAESDRPRALGEPEREPISGRVNGQLYLSGEVADATSKRGGGHVEIRDGQLYRLPVILAILRVINLTIPNNDPFDDARARFYVVGNRVELEDILLNADALTLVGSGSMSLPDRGLDLSLVSGDVSALVDVPGLAAFVEGASRELVALQVTGPLTHPTVKARPFRGINEEIKRLFKKKKRRKIQPASS